MSMSQYLIKIVMTTALVVLISEFSKRSSLIGAVLASVPLVSVIAMIWLYEETRDVAQVSSLAKNIFWLVLPSLLLFIALPWMLARGYGFYLSLSLSIGATIVCYYAAILAIGYFGVGT